MRRTRPGFTLVEAVLAISVGLLVLGATIVGYNQVHNSAAMTNARSTVATINTNIGMEKFRLGSPPPMTPAPASTSSAAVSLNHDSVGKQYYPGAASPFALPGDPVYNDNTIQVYDSTASPTPLAAGDPTDSWDNPIFASTGGSPAYGKGGWLYDPATGAFRINLSNHDYPGDRPGSW